MAVLRKIVGTNTLKTGFMDIFNGDVDEIIDGATVESDGLVKLNKHGGGFIPLDLRPFFYTKTQSENLLTTPLANESTYGKVKRATEEDAINGLDDIKYLSSANLQKKLQDYFSKSVYIGNISEQLLIGNEFSETKVLGSLFVGNNKFYDKSITDGDGDIVKQLGVDSDFQVDGRIEAVSGISVGSDGILITKELGAGGKAFGQVDAQNELRFVSPIVNVTNVLGVNQITGINGAGVAVNAPFTFNQPIYVQPSNNPNSPITNAQFNVALAGGFAVSTTCKLLFNTNQSLAGAKTQGGYTTVTGDNILLNGQTTASENGIYVFDGTNFIRNTANDTSAEIRLKGHLILNGTFASTQWVNNNSTDITVGTTAITYTQWSGAELDPIFTSHPAFGVTNAKIATWDLAATYGTHIGLYVDLVSNQNIGGAKKFLTSIQSPSVRAGSDTLNISMFNYFGVSPRIASTASLDFFTQTNQGFSWTTVGDLTQMRLTPSGLCIGSFGPANYKLDVRGNAGFGGLIFVGNTSQGIAMSSGTAGQFLRRSNVSNGFYNVDVNRWENFGEFGQFQTHAQFGNISALPWGTSFVNGTTTGLPNSGLQAHVVKMSIGSEYPDQATYLAIPRPFANYFDGQIYVRGIYGTADSGWISVGGGNFKDYDFDEYEATIKYHGYFYNNTPEGREGFIGFNRLDGGVILEYKYTEIDSNVTTTYRNIMNSDGRLAYQIGNSEAKRYALLEEVGTGGVGITYTPNEPIFFVGNQINVRTASATQNGVLTKENWTTFNNKQNTLLKASSTQDGYLSKEDFAIFLAGTGGGTGTTYSFTEPIYLDGTAVKVRVASATQNGVLTSTKFSEFDAKLGQGSTVTSFLNFANAKPIYFGYVSQTEYDARFYFNKSTFTPEINALRLQTENAHIFIYTLGSNRNIYLGSNLFDGSIEFSAKKYTFQKDSNATIEIDFSGFAINKVLKATSATKAEWVTP